MEASNTQDATMTRAAEALAAAPYAIALVGAGISVESGIPPFRGPGGLWTKHGEPPMDGYQRLLREPARHWRDLLARRQSDDEFSRAISEAVPNEAHFALADLETMGLLKHTITQNIDNLHAVAGQRAVTEIHGNRTKVRCISCGARWPFAEFPGGDIIAIAGERAPECPQCGGFVKSDTVMFGEPIPEAAIRECYAQAERSGCMLIAGTSATVTPAAWFPEIVLGNGGSLIEVNTEPTPYSQLCIASLRGAAGELLPKLVERVQAVRTKTLG